MKLGTYLRKERFEPKSPKKTERMIRAILTPDEYERFESFLQRRQNADWWDLRQEEILDFYQLVAITYEIKSCEANNLEDVLHTLKTIPNLCKEGKKIFIAGSGPGLLACYLGINYPHKEIIAADISRNMLRIANKRRHKYNLSNLQFWAGDFRETSFFDRHFDTLVCVNSLYETDPDYSLNEFSRILSKGGRLIAKHPQTFPPNSSESYKDFILKRELKLFVDAGFSDIEYDFFPVFLALDEVFKKEIGYVTWQAVKEREPKPISFPYRTDMAGYAKYRVIWPLIRPFKKLGMRIKGD